MKKSDVLRKEAELRDMVEGTDVEWFECVKQHGYFFKSSPMFDADYGTYEFALAVVEGKPVFKGDELYFSCNTQSDKVNSGHNLTSGCWSWNPPKKKTISFNGEELPMPMKKSEHSEVFYVASIPFRNKFDAERWDEALRRAING